MVVMAVVMVVMAAVMVVTTDRIREERQWVLTAFSLAVFVCFPLSALRPVPSQQSAEDNRRGCSEV